MNRRKFLACLGLGAVTVAVPKPKSYFFFDKIWKPSGLQHTVIVNPGESIQDALNKLVPGGQILLRPGVYANMDFSVDDGKSIRLPDDGPATIKDCIIRGEGEMDLRSRNLFTGNIVRRTKLDAIEVGEGSVVVNNVFGPNA